MSKLDSLDFWKGLSSTRRMVAELGILMDEIAENAEDGEEFELDRGIEAALDMTIKINESLRAAY